MIILRSTVLFFVLLSFVDAASSDRPNIVIILADDLGYSDPSCFGGEMETPAIDRLANEGVRLTRFQNAGMCVSTRISMLTGMWTEEGRRRFSDTQKLPELLQSSGYRTALIGKWHLKGHPMDHGFDHFFGFLGGHTDHFKGSDDYRLDREPFRDFGPDFYSSDAYSARASSFIRTTVADHPSQPFFLFLSYQAPHNPLQAPLPDIQRNRGKYLDGWQAIREARFERQKELGIVSKDASLPAYPANLPDWETLSPEERDLEDLRRSAYAAMVERMDQGIGRVLDALNESGRADNTLVLFLSDNGADPFSVLDDHLLKRDKLPGERDSNWQQGLGWAYASNTPWRLYKISQHNGGVTTGAILRWPLSAVKAGSIEHSVVHMVDLLPTLADVAGLSPNLPPRAGESFLPLIKGKTWERKGSLYYQFFDNRAIREGDWTLVEVDHSKWELFNTLNDPLEYEDLSETYPEKVTDLAHRWEAWWRSTSEQESYTPRTQSRSYRPQGDRGTGELYTPSTMPSRLRERYPLP